MHEFAFFYPPLVCTSQTHVVIRDRDLLHRLITVLRVKRDDKIIFFDYGHHVRAHITGIYKDSIECSITERVTHKKRGLTIEAWLPVLKKKDYEEALSLLTEVGAHVIRVCRTEKSSTLSDYDSNHERTLKIIIAAAEQSKNFLFPLCTKPQPLELLVRAQDQPPDTIVSLFCDPAGVPLLQACAAAMHERSGVTTIRILCGPEGDLTPKEKQLIQKEGFQFCSLTPTILRAKHALMVAVGSVHACYAEQAQ